MTVRRRSPSDARDETKEALRLFRTFEAQTRVQVLRLEFSVRPSAAAFVVRFSEENEVRERASTAP
jgi:hypothetical protein